MVRCPLLETCDNCRFLRFNILEKWINLNLPIPFNVQKLKAFQLWGVRVVPGTAAVRRRRRRR